LKSPGQVDLTGAKFCFPAKHPALTFTPALLPLEGKCGLASYLVVDWPRSSCLVFRQFFLFWTVLRRIIGQLRWQFGVFREGSI
jgi:hypothetical protein